MQSSFFLFTSAYYEINFQNVAEDLLIAYLNFIAGVTGVIRQ